jgi:hypothetical protein
VANQLSKAAATQIQALQMQRLDANDSIPANRQIYLPNGQIGDVDMFIQDDFELGNMVPLLQTTIESHLKNPRPDCEYGWRVINRNSPRLAATSAEIRSGRVRPVEWNEIKDNSDAPLEQFSLISTPGMSQLAGTTKDPKYHVVLMDLLLVEIQPAAVKKIYHARLAQAALKMQPEYAKQKFMENGVARSLASRGMLETRFNKIDEE